MDIESIDRMYLNVYVPHLQTPAGVAHFFRHQRGATFASSALMEPLTTTFVAALERFARTQGLPLLTFKKGQRKDEVAAPYRAEFQGEEGVLFIGKAQEKATVCRTEKRHNPPTGRPYPWLVRSTALVNQYYIYAIDRDFGLFFLKFCSYFPYNAKLCLNGHEYLKRQLTQEGIAFEALDNGLLTCADPVRAQTICDELSAPRIYSPRQAAYDLKKLRAKGLLEKVPGTRRYHLPPIGVRTLAALLVLHAQVIKPLLAGIGKPKMGRRPKPKTWTRIDAHYEALRKQMQALFDDLGLAAA